MSKDKISIARITPTVLPHGALWNPVEGVETQRFLANQEDLSPEEIGSLRNETIRILSRCVPPDSTGGDATGLVVGYVQSGKTMSFTALAALARDNNYRLVIVLAGTKNNLFSQSWDRLNEDLNIENYNDWQVYREPGIVECRNISAQLSAATQGGSSVKKPETILIVSKKNPRRLESLVKVFSKIRDERSVDFQKLSTLIIDDEGDQAGLNTMVNDGDFSPTYQKLLKLKAVFPTHTYVHYTATPQAPLLINITDILSPSFAEVISPGKDYVGGEGFFVDNPKLIEVIPDSDPSSDTDIAPITLDYALRIYFVGVADAICKGHAAHGKRSMMVHPSGTVSPHRQYVRWVNAICNKWKGALIEGKGSADYQDLVSDFKEAYDDLKETASDISTFEAILGELREALKYRLKELNSKTASEKFNWSGYSHIIVGGNMLDRGFTVKGLTVTYMPRGEGAAQADTIQQRARFFGYKRKYLGYCRVFLTKNLKEDYEKYVKHEQNIHQQLREIARTDGSLSKWKRAFFLDKKMKPTREQVMDLEYIHECGAKWIRFERPLASMDGIVWNNQVIAAFLKNNGARFKRVEQGGTTHEKAFLDLRCVMEMLLELKIADPYDSAGRTGVLLRISEILNKTPEAKCVLYKMAAGASRYRAVNGKVITQMFQGRNSSGYTGDAAFRDDAMVTVQVHNIEVEPTPKVKDRVSLLTLAIYSPSNSDMLIQTENKKH